MNEKKNSKKPGLSFYRKLEEVVGCKWSVSVLLAIRSGVVRPGALEREIAGISTKVLSERLRKLSAYGLIRKQVYSESPPRTEYFLTEAGERLTDIIGQIRYLDQQIASEYMETKKEGERGHG